MVRQLRPADIPEAARLHAAVLEVEFVSRAGVPFLETYYQAWSGAEAGIALVAVAPDGSLAGLLLGATDSAGHSAAMVRNHGRQLTIGLVRAAIRNPRFGRELVRTRAGRYVKGVARVVRRDRSAPAAGSAAEPIGEVTHLLVAPHWQGRAVGPTLLAAAEELAAGAGLHQLELVTPVDDVRARRFYERRGWSPAGEVTSSSGEDFVRYRRQLDPGDGSPTAAS